MKFWQILVLIAFVAAIGVGVAVWQPWKISSRQISVSAEGKVKGVPDISKITAGVELTKSTATEAQKEATSLLDKIIKAAKDKGIEDKDIRTDDISTSPQYDYDANKTIGFYGRGMVTITVREIAKAQEILDALISAGATSVYGPQLTFSDEKLKTLETQAREEAVKNAKTKADKLAAAGGAKVGKVITIEEQPSGGIYYPMFATESAGDLKTAAGGVGSAIEPGENDISITVSVKYGLK